MNQIQDQLTGDLDISSVLNRIVHWWWIISLAMIVGGVCGMLISRLQKPQFESTSIITTTIDYAYAGRLNDYKEDHLLTAVGEIIGSSVVMKKVEADLKSSDFAVSQEELDKSLTLSRQGYRWELSARNEDPDLAKKVNQVWLDTAMSNLREMRIDSIEAVKLLASQQSLEYCIAQSVAVDPVFANCSLEEFNEILKNFEENNEIEDKDLLEKLLLSQISFQVTQEPNHPLKPVLLGVNLSTFAGAIAGLIVILLVILNYPPQKS